MKKATLLAFTLLASSAGLAQAEGFSLPALLDPLGLFQTSAPGHLGDRTAEGTRYPYADRTRGSGQVLRPKSTHRGGGRNTRLIRD